LLDPIYENLVPQKYKEAIKNFQSGVSEKLKQEYSQL
jgi:hypothetical protein